MNDINHGVNKENYYNELNKMQLYMVTRESISGKQSASCRPRQLAGRVGSHAEIKVL
jgi:hypothetical protein